MTGTLVNAAAVAAGSLIGLGLKKGLPKRIEDIANQAGGAGVFIIGLNGVLTSMLSSDTSTGKISENGSMMLVLCMIIGGVIGEIIGIDKGLNNLGGALERKMGRDGIAKGFVTASLVFCVGAMAIVGSISDGLTGDSSVLFVKSVLDFTFAIVFTATLGIGVIFSAVAVLVYQGAITICAGLIAPYITELLLGQICMIGYCIVMLLGFNMLGITKIKVANLLPAMLGPVVYNFIVMLKIPWG